MGSRPDANSVAQALLYPGPVALGQPYSNQLLPKTGLAYSFGTPNTDVSEMLAAGALAVGAPNATTCHTQIGAVHLYFAPLASSQQPSFVFQLERSRCPNQQTPMDTQRRSEMRCIMQTSGPNITPNLCKFSGI